MVDFNRRRAVVFGGENLGVIGVDGKDFLVVVILQQLQRFRSVFPAHLYML